MNTNISRNVNLLVLYAVIIGVIFFIPRSVLADDIWREGYFWELVFVGFYETDGVVEGELIVEHVEAQIDPNTGSILQYNPLNTITHIIRCIVVGDVEIKNGKATFNGNGYLQCNFPDLVPIVQDLIVSDWPILATEAYAEIFMEVSAKLDPSTEYENPIFYHPSLKFSAVAESSETQLISQLGTEEWKSTAFMLDGGWRSLEFNYDCLYPYHPDIAPSGCTTEFSYGDLSNPHTEEVVNFLTESTAIYIGYSPDTGNYFKGSIKYLRLDPGKFGS